MKLYKAIKLKYMVLLSFFYAKLKENDFLKESRIKLINEPIG